MGFLRFILTPLTPLFWVFGKVRNWLYDRGIIISERFENRTFYVIGIGNLNIGGSGKTPMTEYLVRKLSRTYKTAILSRGYGRKTSGFRIAGKTSSAREIGDEPMQYHLKFDHIKIAVCENRVKGIERLVKLHPELRIIILDDAFQHRRLTPDFNILLSPYQKPFFKKHLMPLGWLREPRSGAARADHLIFTKCPESAGPEKINRYIKRAQRYFNGPVSASSIQYGEAYHLSDNSPATFPQKCTLVTGIASSTPFKNYVSEQTQIKKHFEFGDHYAFRERNIWQFNRINIPIITTEKDATKLYQFIDKLMVSVIVVPIETQFIFNEAELLASLQTKISSKVEVNATV